jgi:hypothetical protein
MTQMYRLNIGRSKLRVVHGGFQPGGRRRALACVLTARLPVFTGRVTATSEARHAFEMRMAMCIGIMLLDASFTSGLPHGRLDALAGNGMAPDR